MQKKAASVKTDNIIKKDNIKHETSLVSNHVIEVTGLFEQAITSGNAG